MAVVAFERLIFGLAMDSSKLNPPTVTDEEPEFVRSTSNEFPVEPAVALAGVREIVIPAATSCDAEVRIKAIVVRKILGTCFTLLSLSLVIGDTATELRLRGA